LHATWAKRGCQPEIPVTGARKSIKVFGCIDVTAAEFNHKIDTVFNVKTYLNFLEEVAKIYHREKIFYIQDNASYHKNSEVWQWFKDNRDWIEVCNLPPYSPEFNATERLWHHTRISGTHNRYFDSESSLLKALECVFADMKNDPSKIKGYLQPFL
jgi:transposase